MTFADVAARFEKTQPPDQLPETWLSPYRLLWGAAYAIGTAERSRGGWGEVPLDLSPFLRGAVERPEDSTMPWLPFWRDSFMLTNAIYRIAASAEKVCGLVTGRTEEIRAWLWDEARTTTSCLSKALPLAHGLLKDMPPKKDHARRAYLHAQRETFRASGQPPTPPLVCAFIQTDTDKHVPYGPLKELMFDRALAITSFLEACDLWDAAADASRADGPSSSVA
jgi:hypothetical protein